MQLNAGALEIVAELLSQADALGVECHTVADGAVPKKSGGAGI